MNIDKEKYVVTVAEPWDFESPDGKNIIGGVVLSIVNSHLLVFKSNYILNFGGVSGDVLILSPRFNGGNFDNIRTEEIDVNGGLFLDDYSNGVEESKLKENCKFVLIGTLDFKK